MKIGLEIQPILKNKTGVGWYTQNIIENLQNDNLLFEGYGFNFLNRNNIMESLLNIQFDTKINKLMPYGVYRRLWDMIPVSYNKIFNSKADIYHFFNYIVPPKIEGKVIVTVYDMVYKLFPETMTRKNYNRLDKELTRSISRADKVITISENSKKEILQYFDINEQKIDIIYPGIDNEIYTRKYNINDEKKVKQKYNLPENYILYLGTLEPRKNIIRIIDAYYELNNKIKDIKLVLAGSKGWMYDDIFKKIKDYGLEDKVIITGYIDEEDKPLLYKMSNAFVFPSLYEGFGMPVLEAMASGVPVITSNTSSLPEVVGDAGFLTDLYNTKELADAIIEVLENEELRAKMIDKGLKQSQKFSWKKSAKKLIEIYKEVGRYEKSID